MFFIQRNLGASLRRISCPKMAFRFLVKKLALGRTILGLEAGTPVWNPAPDSQVESWVKFSLGYVFGKVPPHISGLNAAETSGK